jgi:zinc/manganese transport system substrate-binding protein
MLRRPASSRWTGWLARAGVSFAIAAVTALTAGCSVRAGTGGASTTALQVVAAEDVWGSIAAQLGGARTHVTSIIANPNTDPHDYEPTVADARAIATARLLILNGVGYDPWVAHLAAASPDPSRTVLDVGALVGARPGDNPHLWYSPAAVRVVVARITGDYKRLDPAGAAFYDAERRRFERTALARYDALVAEIRTRYAGTPIGASESIVTPLADGLGLKVLTPQTFLVAISEGTGPATADKATVDAQIRSRAIKVFIYNSQNATPDVAALVIAAKAHGIPVVTMTETMVPAAGTFQGWQTAQLEALRAALRQATGR